MPKPDAHAQADALIEEEALRVARSIQKPGQTKEQTKLIAQGVAKGIALYKKQQSAKARERDRNRKRVLKVRINRTEPDQHVFGEADAQDSGAGGAISVPLLTGGAIFAIMALLHLARVLADWVLVVGPWSVPSWVSLIAAALLGGLSAWFFHQATR